MNPFLAEIVKGDNIGDPLTAYQLDTGRIILHPDTYNTICKADPDQLHTLLTSITVRRLPNLRQPLPLTSTPTSFTLKHSLIPTPNRPDKPSPHPPKSDINRVEILKKSRRGYGI